MDGSLLDQARGEIDEVRLELRVAHRNALGLEEGVGHAAADQQGIDLVEQVLDDLDLVGDLGPAQDRHEGALRRLQDALEDLDLALQEHPGHRGEVLGDPDHRAVGAVGGAEGIVHEDVAEARQGRRESGVVLGLAREEAHVLEQQRPPWREPRDGLLGLGRRRIGDEGHLEAQVTPEGSGHRSQRVARIRAALGPAEVRHQDQTPTSVEDSADRRQAGGDAGLVGDLPVLERDVEVDAHQDPLPGHLDVVERLLLHVAAPPPRFLISRAPPGPSSDRGSGSSSPTRCRTRTAPSPCRPP